MTNEFWLIYEFECESNENLDYFQLNCSSLGSLSENIIYGGSYKYEIILNDHSIKFSNPDFKYSVKDDKITLEGYIDGNKENFTEEKFFELAKKYCKESYIDKIDEINQDDKLANWVELRFKEFIPEKMMLV